MKTLLAYLTRGALEGEAEGGSAAAAGTTILTAGDATVDDQTKPNPLVEKGTDGVTDPDPNVKKPDGGADEKKDTDKNQDDKKKPANAEAENEYLGKVDGDYDIKTPEGFEVDDEIKGEFSTAAKEIGLSQKGVERLVGIQTKLQENAAKRTAAMVADWDKQSRADKEIGGKDFDANAAIGREFLSNFADEEVNVLLDRTGLGNHPAVVKMFVRAGKAMGEAKVTKGDGGGKRKDAAEILYPNEKNGA